MGFDMSIRKIAFAAVVGAAYAALTMALAPLSYGPVQFRISEILCILPFFFPFTAWGLFIGCVIANLLSAYGALDIVFGSLATLAAAVCTMAIGYTSRERTIPKILACLPPVVFNGIIVGALIAYYQTTTASGIFWTAFLVNSLWVGFGELVVLYALGLPALLLLPKSSFFRSLNALYTRE